MFAYITGAQAMSYCWKTDTIKRFPKIFSRPPWTDDMTISFVEDGLIYLKAHCIKMLIWECQAPLRLHNLFFFLFKLLYCYYIVVRLLL